MRSAARHPREPARVVHHARRLIVRLAPGPADGPLTTGYDLLSALPGPAGWPFCLTPTRHRHDPDRAGGSPQTATPRPTLPSVHQHGPSGHQHADPCSVAVPSSRAHAQREAHLVHHA